MTTLVLIALVATAFPVNADDVFAFLIKIAPILAALGLWQVLASTVGLLWDKFGAFVGSTPNKADDFVYHLVDPAVQEVKRLIAAGDVDGAHQKLDALTALAANLSGKK